MPLALACQPMAYMVWDESEDLQLSYDVAGTPFDMGMGTGSPRDTQGLPVPFPNDIDVEAILEELKVT
jgi:hypothetical protein